MTRVTLDALLVYARSDALPPESPPPVIGSQIHPQSGTIEIVDIKSSQKKKLKM